MKREIKRDMCDDDLLTVDECPIVNDDDHCDYVDDVDWDEVVFLQAPFQTNDGLSL